MHRLDVGTSGLMVVAKSERAYTSLKRAVPRAHGRQALPRAGPGPPRPDERHDRRAHRPAPAATTTSGRSPPRASRPSRTTTSSRRSARPRLLDIKLETGRTHQIRVHMAAHRHPCVGDLTYGADPTLAKRLGLTRQWLHAVRLGFEHPADGQLGRVRERLPGGPARRPGRVREESVRMTPPSYVVRVAEDPADREACFAVRKEVFVAEQRVPEDLEYDAFDAGALHVLAVREDGVRARYGAAAVRGGGRRQDRGRSVRGVARAARRARRKRAGWGSGSRSCGASRRRLGRWGLPRWICTRRRRARVLRAARVCGVRGRVLRGGDRASGDAPLSLSFLSHPRTARVGSVEQWDLSCGGAPSSAADPPWVQPGRPPSVFRGPCAGLRPGSGGPSRRPGAGTRPPC